MQDEAESITASGTLRGGDRVVDKSYMLGFDMVNLYNQFRAKTSVALRLCEAMTTSARQVAVATASRLSRKRDVRPFSLYTT